MAKQKTELENLKEQKQAILDSIELERLRRQVGLLDSTRRTVTRESWGDLVDLSDPYRDTPGFGRLGQLDARVSTASDRVGGKNSPFVESESDLAIIRGIGRYVSAMSENGIGVLENLCNYTIGTGFQYEANERAETREAIPEGLVSAVQYLVDEFLERNDFVGDLEEEIFRDAVIDGDVGIRLHAKAGKADCRLVTAEFITEPADRAAMSEYAGAYDLDWSFGVGTEPGDVQSVYGYNVAWDASKNDWEYVPADEMEFIRRNVPKNVKRGVSDFFPVGKRLELADKVLTNVGIGTAIQAAIAYIVENSPSLSQSQIETLVTNATDYSYSQTYGNKGSRTVSERYFGPGTIIDTTNRKYQPSPLAGSGNAVFLPVQQAILRAVGVRWNMPEYMVSGDASNANYASTMVAESPFIKSVVRAQAKLGNHFVSLIWKAIKIAIDAGRLPGIETVGQLKRMVTITATPPDPTVRDPEKEARVKQIENAAGVLSRRTWANEVGRDYDIETENMGTEPPVGQAAQLPTGLEQQAGRTTDVLPATVAAALRGALESVESTEHAKAVLRSLWEGYP